MTNKELQGILKQHPDDLEIMTTGYEGGYDYADIRIDDFVINYINSSYQGKHETLDQVKNTEGYKIIKGILIY